MAIDNILHLYRNTYYRSPQWIKTVVGGAYGHIPLRVRFGNAYQVSTEELLLLDRLNRNEQTALYFNKLVRTIAFAETHIPYYRELYRNAGVSAKDLRSARDLKFFPAITKADIKDNLAYFYTDKFQKKTAYYTGGSTSEPMKFYLPLFQSRGKEKAFSNYIFAKLGKKPRARTALFKGRGISRTGKGLCEYEPVDNYLVVPSNSIAPETVSKIVNEVTEFGAEFVFGYPSTIIEFIRVARRSGIEKLPCKGVLLASEMAMKNELAEIEKYFDCSCLLHYGHSERAAVAYKLSSEPYRFLCLYGFARCVENEIVATSFDNYVMPFINYRTNDYVSGSLSFLNDSDVMLEAEHIEGRLQENLVTRDGRLISVCTMGAGHYGALANADLIQYEQFRPGAAILHIKGNVDEVKVKEELERFVGGAIEFTISRVNEIEKTTRGKRLLLRQHCDIEKVRDQCA